MAGSSAQIRQIIDRLIEKTTSAELRWSEGFGRSSISTRLGDYQVSLNRPFNGADVEMTVSDISSNESLTIGGGLFSTTAQHLFMSGVNPQEQGRLNKLFQDITSESQTLNGLLRALG